MTPQHIHFTGMGSLAGLLKARGLEVTGSDSGLYPPMSTALERWQIPVNETFSAGHIRSDVDLFVIGNAVHPDNPEAVAAIATGTPYRSFSDALYELAMADKHSVVVSGTHGKTTTTNLTAFLLAETERDPSLLVGGISLDFDGSFREGKGLHFVVEGDEYDTAFFDKTPKFLHYHPQTLILTSVEFDHADICRDLDHVMSAFRELVQSMPEHGSIVASDHGNVREVVSGAPCRVVSYGLSDEAAWRASDLESNERGTSFELSVEGESLGIVQVPLHGAFNVENAVAALAAVTALGVPMPLALEALPRTRGVKRRQEIRGEVAGVTVVDDFAHHPTAVKGSIAALRARFPEGRLVAVFEPRTNTSRRAIFQDDYAQAFDAADRALVYEVPGDEPIYSATGEVTELFSSFDLCEALSSRGTPADAFPDVDAIVACVVSEARPGDVVLVMSNGGFDGIWEKLLEALRTG